MSLVLVGYEMIIVKIITYPKCARGIIVKSFLCFPALDTGCMLSRAWHVLVTWHQLHDFKHSYLPKLGTDCMFTRVCHRLHASVTDSTTERLYPTIKQKK